MTRSVRLRRSLMALAAVATVFAMVVPAWASFPDQGNRVLYGHAKSTVAAARGTGGIDLFTMKPNGEDQRRIVKSAVYEYGGHWSPNGSNIVFTGIKGKGQANVYTTDADGSHRQQLTTSNREYSPNWSKNGKQIVWTRLSALKPRPSLHGTRVPRGTGGNLMVMNADGTEKHSIFPGTAIAPGWDPTSQRIAFSTFDTDSTDIWTIKPNGLGLQQFTDYGVGSTALFGDWSPDGESFIFTWSPGIVKRGTGPIYSLWIAPVADPTDTVMLADSVNAVFAPMFSADGSRVLFVGQESSDLDIFSVKTDGTGRKDLSDNDGLDILTVLPLF